MPRMLDPYDFELVRRQDPEPPPPYTCAICGETVIMKGSPYTWPTAEFRQGPVCQGCTNRWGHSNVFQRIHKTERRKAMKLQAVVSALQWEIMNGNGRWRRGLGHAEV